MKVGLRHYYNVRANTEKTGSQRSYKTFFQHSPAIDIQKVSNGELF